MRKHGPKPRAGMRSVGGVVSSWGDKEMGRARAMVEETDVPLVDIAIRMKAPYPEFKALVEAKGWTRPRITDPRKKGPAGSANVGLLTHRPGPSLAGVVVRHHPPLPGSTPRPYHTVVHGQDCRFILDDPGAGMMDVAETCCLPVERDADDKPKLYCAGHTKLAARPAAPGSKKPISAKELARSLRRYL